MPTELISIIVPIYNVENYLDNCVSSIVHQTYKNLEIILVDDGSPDNCPTMCDNWAKKDGRIKVIHKPNGGLSDARNAGLRIATGSLIGFVDSDDYIHENMFACLYNSLKANDCDISICGVEKFYENDETEPLTTSFVGTLSVDEAMLAIINEDIIKQPVWNRLYKSETIKDIYFPINKCNEDVFWSYRALSRAKSISVFNTPLYFYRQRGESIMGNAFSLKRLDILEAKFERLQFIENNFPSVKPYASENLWFSLIYLMQMCYKHISGDDFNTAKEKIVSMKKACVSPKIKYASGIKQKIWLFLSKISFLGTCKLRTMLGIGF